MEFTGERFIPEAGLGSEIEIEHLQRYQAVLPLVAGKTVLDAAAGSGYGTAQLASGASQAHGVEIDSEAVAHARGHYRADNLFFHRASIAALPLADASMEVVVSFETIEHVDEATQEQFLAEVKRVLRPGGLLIISTPDRAVYSDHPGYHNEFHIKEFYRDEFREFLAPAFAHLAFHEQAEQLAYVIHHGTASGPFAHFPVAGRPLPAGKYIIALCSDAPLDGLPPLDLLTLDPDNTHQAKIDRVLALQDEVDVKNGHITRLEGEVAGLHKDLEEIHAINSRAHRELDHKQEEINVLLAQAAELRHTLAQETTRLTGELTACRHELDHIKATKAWRLIQRCYRIKNRLLALLIPGRRS